jgi:hypothetical protein
MGIKRQRHLHQSLWQDGAEFNFDCAEAAAFARSKLLPVCRRSKQKRRRAFAVRRNEGMRNTKDQAE